MLSIRLFRLCTVLFLSSCFLFTDQGFEPKTVQQQTTDTVIINRMKFIPATITVHKGDTITFINKGIVNHDVTEIHHKWGSPPLKPGDSWTMVAKKSVHYYCSIHKVMKGKIIVK